MKKKKKKSVSLSPALVGLLFLTAASLGSIGVIHAVMKNRQLTLGRKTEEVSKRIAERERDLTNAP